ncbi:MAG: phosphoribosyl-ATP diphosphatase [Balneolaceae bacterium]
MPDDTQADIHFLYDLEKLLKSRKTELPKGSYSTKLFEDGIDQIAQKVGEEAVELLIASKNDDEDETVYESADLLFHLLVLLVEKEISLDQVIGELKNRRK